VIAHPNPSIGTAIAEKRAIGAHESFC
jgi:hypothetical protein